MPDTLGIESVQSAQVEAQGTQRAARGPTTVGSLRQGWAQIGPCFECDSEEGG
jgi:hypothetical protein